MNPRSAMKHNLEEPPPDRETSMCCFFLVPGEDELVSLKPGGAPDLGNH